MQDQASRAGKSKATLEKEREKEFRAKEKAEEEKRKKMEAELFKPVQVQKVPFGVDPKTVLCGFFKAGNCEKGNKCKFSHDLQIERKTQKKDLYSDSRDEKLNDTMDKWDEEKLRSVVLSKAGNPRTTTDIVCKHFIQAIETEKFGWFWECPNGSNCMYRHALPPGFVLKSQRKALDDASRSNVISLEEFLEVERHKLGSNLTPVTPESFAKWKQNRMDKKEAEAEALRKAKEAQTAAGKLTGMSGRDLVRIEFATAIVGELSFAGQFTFNPDWFEDEEVGAEEDWDLSNYLRERAETDAIEEAQRIHAFNVGFEQAVVDTPTGT
ncbi:hypothetical protein FRC03_008977 [Tulasnella sp. 419]|nr:hypothetical protein FRC03_008977 [Tulasnella sp. 419]